MSGVCSIEQCFQLPSRFGQVENARRHLFSSQLPDSAELQKLQTVEKHIRKCVDARKIGDWNSSIREGDAAISAGADSSPQVSIPACKKYIYSSIFVFPLRFYSISFV